MPSLLELQSIDTGYQSARVVHDLSMRVKRGSLACLLGPSGCGKTTVLRAVAGFNPVTRGEIRLRGQVVSSREFTLPPEKRRLGMVFQDHALFPHLDVSRNIGFGLRGRSSNERERVVDELLEVVGLAGLGGRYPHELSGGQQRRVSLARALAPQPDLVLLDEPFSGLDIELRERLGADVGEIFRQREITAVLVTHDQEEAFALSDAIGVMRDGGILQWDTAYNLYHEPADRFIADFIGQGVFLRGSMLTQDSIETEVGVFRGNRAYGWPAGCQVDVLLRPDDIVPDEKAETSAQVASKAFRGADTLYSLKLPTGSIVLSLFPSHLDYRIGEHVRVSVAPDHLVAFRV